MHEAFSIHPHSIPTPGCESKELGGRRHDELLVDVQRPDAGRDQQKERENEGAEASADDVLGFDKAFGALERIPQFPRRRLRRATGDGGFAYNSPDDYPAPLAASMVFTTSFETSKVAVTITTEMGID